MKSPEFLTSKGVDVQKSLELFGDIETYNATIGDFIVGAAGKTNKLKEYMAAKDMTNYAIYVHSLKSDAKYFGFTKLAELAYEHELRSKAGDVYYVYDKFNDLVAVVNEAISLVKEYMSDAAPASSTINQEPQQLVATAPVDNPSVSKGEIYTTQTILVVDDSNIVRNFVKRIFDGKYAVGTAKNGQEAIDLIESNKDNDYIIAVLLDLNMPRVDGFEVLKYMDENNHFDRIPVSIITGDSSKETIDKAYEYPIVDMIGKPFNESSIKTAVEKTIMYKEML